MKLVTFALLFPFCAFAEVKMMTLRQALDLALKQNPDLLMSRLDQQKARDQVLIAKDPFLPKIFGGSGLAWSQGYPITIDGNPPSIFEAQTKMAMFDRSQSYQVAGANEGVKGAAIDIAKRQEDVIYRVASLFLDAEQSARSLAAAQRQVENLTRVRELVDVRVSEGRELPLQSMRANLNAQHAKKIADDLALDLINAETNLAIVLGLNPDDRVRPLQEERPALKVPVSEEETIEEALENSQELKRLQSNMQMRTLDVKSFKAARLPKVNLVAQYNVFAKYNYTNYNVTFRRNNTELGASIEVPILAGRTSTAYASQAEADIAKMRIQFSTARSRITADIRRAFQEVKRAESGRDFAQADLDVAREEISVYLAQYGEGKIPMATVETARALENEKWLAYYVAQENVERARLNLLHETGSLLAALK